MNAVNQRYEARMGFPGHKPGFATRTFQLSVKEVYDYHYTAFMRRSLLSFMDHSVSSMLYTYRTAGTKAANPENPVNPVNPDSDDIRIPVVMLNII
jgi:hypothetical protein